MRGRERARSDAGSYLTAWFVRITMETKSRRKVSVLKDEIVDASSQSLRREGLLFLGLSAAIGIVVDVFVFHAFRLNYILIGMAFSATLVNRIPEEKTAEILEPYAPVLNVSLVLVIVNLGMPLDYRLIAGAGLFTAVYILSRALGKIGGAYLGGKWTKAPDTVTRYLGFTLLPHSGVSLVFTGIAATTLSSIDPSLAAIVQGTIVAAAIINEVIAVVIAKYAFQWAGEIQTR